MKIAIVGAGEVGATVGYACLLRGVCDKLVLCDVDAAKAEAQALDLAHGVQFARMADVWGSDDIGDCAGADVIVLAAGAKQRPEQTRLDLAADNVALCRAVVDRTGVAERLDVPLDDEERAGLESSAAEIRRTCATVGL